MVKNSKKGLIYNSTPQAMIAYNLRYIKYGIKKGSGRLKDSIT